MYKMKISQIEDELKTDDIVGLSGKEALRRLEINGYNELPKAKKDSIFKLLIDGLKEPITLLLIVAIIASLLVGEVVDATAIFFIVVIDLIIGIVEENKANNTALALSNLVKSYSKVIRNNKEQVIEARELVVGDIILLESGDKIPADIRIINCNNLEVDEAMLTGESVAVSKNPYVINKDCNISEQSNMLFAGCSVVTGRCKGVVVSTSTNTEIGKIATFINDTEEEKSPLTIKVDKFSKTISCFILVVAFIITILLIIKGVPYTEIFLSVIALSVSAMPEGLPLALTMALTIASNRMAKENVITKKLYSVESLGSCSVIASDKTGTLTVNSQTAKKIIFPDGSICDITGEGTDINGKITGNIDGANRIGFLCDINNESSFVDNKYIGDSIDIAFRVLYKKCKADRINYSIVDNIPYESQNKYSACFYEIDDKFYVTVKGSLETVLKYCKISDKVKNDVIKQNELLASEGYRVIAVADGKAKRSSSYTSDDINNLEFIGLVGFIDPIRPEAIKSILECKKAGIDVLMITGDHPLTAYKIGRDLKLVDNYDLVTTSSEVDEYFNKGIDAFDEFVKSKKIFTRVTPLQKMQIVESIKRRGEYVAVTGDGVNDAPALRAANISVAMGSGTDVSKETAKMIVSDDNFTSIVKGVREGRIAYKNIRKITYFLISSGLAEILFYLLSILFNMPTPLVAIQLLWLNVVTDGIQDISLSFEKGEDDIMNNVNSSELFDKKLFSEIMVSGLYIGLLVFSLFYVFINVFKMDLVVARGYTMALMVFIQNIHVFNCRSEEHSIFSKKVPVNYFAFIGVFASIMLQILVMEISPLSLLLKTTKVPFMHMIYLFAISLSVLVIMEIYKKIKSFNK